ncbi:MAG: GNAT family N-acetyltransferase [Aquabacterium sp.]|nr:GNAT family N-acetyltransferase [Aquabacterium sp.]
MHIELITLPDQTKLEGWWRELESRAEARYFTSWSWIGSWLAILPRGRQPKLLIAKQDGMVVGLGLLVKGRTRLLKVIPVPCWYLHETGNLAFDDLVIEYNGFLLDKACASDARDAMLSFMLQHCGSASLAIRHADSSYERWAGDQAHCGSVVRTDRMTSYLVDLKRARQTEGGHLAMVSANTRSQVRRSLKAYAELGPVVVHAAETLAQAKSYLTLLKRFNERSWAKRGQRSGFASSHVAANFHETLLASSFARGEIQMLRISAGDTDLGYLYNFVHRGHVAFYQSGLNYGLLDKLDRPGLVCHTLAIEHNTQCGHSSYDFLAGDHRYKSSLSTQTEGQLSHLIHGSNPIAALDQAVRTWLQRWRAWPSRPVMAAQWAVFVCADVPVRAQILLDGFTII